MGNTPGRGCRCICLDPDVVEEPEEIRLRLISDVAQNDGHQEVPVSPPAAEPSVATDKDKEQALNDAQTATPSESGKPDASFTTNENDLDQAGNIEPSVEVRTPKADFAALRSSSRLLQEQDWGEDPAPASKEEPGSSSPPADTTAVAPEKKAPAPAPEKKAPTPAPEKKAPAPAPEKKAPAPAPEKKAPAPAPAKTASAEAPAAAPAEAPAVASTEAPADASVGSVLPAMFAGLWESIPGTLEGLEGMLDLQGVGWMQKKMALKMAPTIKIKLEITNDGPKVLVVITKPRATETKEFVLDGPPFETTIALGEKNLNGTGEAFLESNGTQMVVSMKHSDGYMKVSRRIEGGQLLECAEVEKGGKRAIVKRKYQKVG